MSFEQTTERQAAEVALRTVARRAGPAILRALLQNERERRNPGVP
jgi:hypothetical protein